MSDVKLGYELDMQVGYLLRLANQRHATIFQELAPQGLTATQFSALIRLSENGPCSQNHLGRLGSMDIATIKGVVDRLRDKGLVKTMPSLEDKRRSIVSLTPEGQNLIAPLQEAGINITEKTLAPLDASERAALCKLLKKIT